MLAGLHHCLLKGQDGFTLAAIRFQDIHPQDAAGAHAFQTLPSGGEGDMPTASLSFLTSISQHTQYMSPCLLFTNGVWTCARRTRQVQAQPQAAGAWTGTRLLDPSTRAASQKKGGRRTQRGQHSAISVHPRRSRSPIPIDTRLWDTRMVSDLYVSCRRMHRSRRLQW